MEAVGPYDARVFVGGIGACRGAGGMALAVGRFTFVLACPEAFQLLGDGGPIALIIGWPLGAVVHLDTGLLAVEFETGASVGIWGLTPKG